MTLISDNTQVRLSLRDVFGFVVALVLQTAFTVGFVVIYQEKRFNAIENSTRMDGASILRIDRAVESHETRLDNHDSRLLRLEN